MRFRLILLASSVVATTAMAADAQKASFPVNAKPDTKMSFFITGFGTSHGGNFEGLARDRKSTRLNSSHT